MTTQSGTSDVLRFSEDLDNHPRFRLGERSVIVRNKNKKRRLERLLRCQQQEMKVSLTDMFPPPLPPLLNSSATSNAQPLKSLLLQPLARPRPCPLPLRTSAPHACASTHQHSPTQEPVLLYQQQSWPQFSCRWVHLWPRISPWPSWQPSFLRPFYARCLAATEAYCRRPLSFSNPLYSSLVSRRLAVKPPGSRRLHPAGHPHPSPACPSHPSRDALRTWDPETATD
mmetsp:Transcript_23104/g.57040  ORF Transcript_23104/g.57040 Transcript_23104/m.57040 type:complete len:227 (-) Transcript_23104:46-726(-)